MAAVIASIVAGQVFAPTHFSSLGKQKTSLTYFLRAVVKMGDSYLIKEVFHDALVAEYPVVFDTYLQESEWLEHLKAVEFRSPESRDVLAALAVLYDRMGNSAEADVYRNRIRFIDPVYKFSETK